MDLDRIDRTLLKLYARPLTQFIPAPHRTLLSLSGPQERVPRSATAIVIDRHHLKSKQKIQTYQIKSLDQSSFHSCPVQPSGTCATAIFSSVDPHGLFCCFILKSSGVECHLWISEKSHRFRLNGVNYRVNITG